MNIKAEDISKVIRDHIGTFAVDVDVAEVGTVVSLGDGIARVRASTASMAGEMLEFPNGLFGIALNLEEDERRRRAARPLRPRSKKATPSSAPAASCRCRSATN